MLPAIVTALLLGIMLLLVASFIVGALREYRRHKQSVAAQSLPTPLERHVTAVLHLQDGMVMSVEKPRPLPGFSLPPGWYRRRRTLVSLGLLLMVVVALATQGEIVGDAVRTFVTTFSFFNAPTSMSLQTAPHPLPNTASARIVRVDSAARDQYYTDYQWQVWSYASCSGIALEEVMNAYGRHLIAADVLQVELQLGVWDVRLGLLTEQGIALTANYFGFAASLSHSRSLKEIIAIANGGTPVIVSVRDSTYFPGGHIFVVRGGDDQSVSIVDSSPADFTRMSYPMFTAMWQSNNDFSAIVTPR
jgi:hypothetical protein